MRARIIRQYSLFPVVVTAIGLAALFVPLPVGVRAALTAAYFLALGAEAGKAFLNEDHHFLWRTFFGLLAVLSCAIVAGAAIYRLYRLDLTATALLIAALPWAAAAAGSLWRPAIRLSAAERPPRSDTSGPFHAAATLALIAISLAFIAAATGVIGAASTEASIRSPWDVVPRMTFVLYFLAALAAAAAAIGDSEEGISALPVTALAAVSVSVAAGVYAIGYGFDPFIHQATELAIAAQGAIEPKPFYYLGQYAIVSVLSRLTGFGVVAIDRWLVPAAFTAAVPAIYWSLRRGFGMRQGTSAAAAIGMLLYPLSSFIATTPQGLANVLTLFATFLLYPAFCGTIGYRLPALLTLAALAVHPIAGAPLAFVVGGTMFLGRKRAPGTRTALAFAVLAIAGAAVLPALFFLNAALSSASVSFNTTLLRQPSAAIGALQETALETRRFIATFDFVYAWYAIRETALLAAAAAGFLLLRRRAKNGIPYALGFTVFLLGALALRTLVDFPFLIGYERTSYADRLRDLALLVTAPLGLYALAALLERIRRAAPSLKMGSALALALLATSSFYLAYPRRDPYDSSRGWSTSVADIEAVRSIHKDASGTDYVVLANQSVSAAAIREYGFKRYYAPRDRAETEPVFFYPVPTGGALYEIFLDMNDGLGSRDAAERAMRLTGTETVYFVVTNYWWQARRIIASARGKADDWWSVNDTDFVFKYSAAADARRD